MTAIIAPGGTGKSTIGNTIALCLASGQPILGKPLHRGPQAVWIFNLEDGTDELERQLSAACAYHGIGPEDCRDRLHLDSGLVQPLCTASEDRDGFTLAEEVFAQLAATIRERCIATVIVDPFVSSHAVRESSNEAIDAIAKRWKRLAQETGCAVVLVHHTRKLGGREVTAEDGRGAVALRDAALHITARFRKCAIAGEEGFEHRRYQVGHRRLVGIGPIVDRGVVSKGVCQVRCHRDRDLDRRAVWKFGEFEHGAFSCQRAPPQGRNCKSL